MGITLKNKTRWQWTKCSLWLLFALGYLIFAVYRTVHHGNATGVAIDYVVVVLGLSNAGLALYVRTPPPQWLCFGRHKWEKEEGPMAEMFAKLFRSQPYNCTRCKKVDVRELPYPAEFTLTGGQRIFNNHAPEKCEGQHCCLHNPSDHHMRDWKQNWRNDRGLMERICEHGIGHPDPDDLNPDTVHGCDGCCTPNRKKK